MMYYHVKRRPEFNDCTFTISIEEEYLPVRGNAQVSGDEEADRDVENWIIGRLISGDIWAWCIVRVTAEWEGLRGDDYLGACCYASEEDFKTGGYFEDMQQAAYQHLLLDNGLPVKQPRFYYDSKGNKRLR